MKINSHYTYVGGIFLLVFVVAVVLKLFGVLESFQQFVVVMLSAAATYVIVVVTQHEQSKEQQMLQQMLMKQQGENDKELKTHEKKIGVYSEFVSYMFETLRDSKITEEEFIDLRTRLLGKLCFYVNSQDTLLKIKEQIDSIKTYTDNDTMLRVFAKVTSILQSDLDNNDKFETTSVLLELARKFDEISDNTRQEIKNSDLGTESESKEGDSSEDETSIELKRIDQPAWHFIMWSDTQLSKLKEGFKELSLIEYGEYWRTNLVTQVCGNDIIMLFRRGGYGYVGAYRAIGWRVFYFEEEKEVVLVYGKEEQVIKGEQYLADINEYDIYKSYEDDATTCHELLDTLTLGCWVVLSVSFQKVYDSPDAKA